MLQGMSRAVGTRVSFRYDYFVPQGPITNALPPMQRAQLLALPNPALPPPQLIQELLLHDPSTTHAQHYGLRTISRWNGIETVDLPASAPIETDEVCLYPIEPRVEPCFIYGLSRDGEQISPTFLDDISEDALQKIITGQFQLVINYLSEGYSAKRFFIHRLQEQLLARGIPPENVHFYTSNADIQSSLRELFTEQDLRIQVRFWPFWECFYALSWHNQQKILGDYGELESAERNLPLGRSKHFLCLNRYPQAHRHALLCLLIKHNLLGKGLVSFPPALNYKTLEFNGDWMPLEHIFQNHALLPELRNISEEQLKKIAPLVVDQQDFSTNFAGQCNETLYSDTFFSVIAETQFYENCIFVSEKTFKAIRNLHPFLLLAPPGTLRMLRRNGYKTFAPFINEDYDEIKNHAERLLAVVAELNRLCSLTQSEMIAWYQKVSPLIEHNREHLFDLSRQRTDSPETLFLSSGSQQETTLSENIFANF